MDALHALLTRRSIRSFQPMPVDPASLRTVLDAAMHAATASNQQPWRFIIIQDREKLEAIAREHPHASVLKECPSAVLVCAHTPDLSNPDFWPSDCAAATQNLMLAAHALGLGTVWISIYPRKERMDLLSKILQIPEGVVPFSLIPIGHPAERPEHPERYHPEWIRVDRWFEPWGPAKD